MSQSVQNPPDAAAPTNVDKSDAGYSKGLKNRHIQMIAIGGSIGTGLLMGAGSRLSQGGPALALVYLLCGIFTFIMVRALGELAVYRPSSGAFVSYAREFMGEKGAYITGWMFFLDWWPSGMADVTAVALYVHYWKGMAGIPQWLIALIALAFIFVINILSVKFFGEFEFWFAMIKVAAILIFMVVAIISIVTNAKVGNTHASPALMVNHGGFFAMGVAPMFTLGIGVIFAFGGTEMVGVAAGEAKNAAKILPKAVNSMMWRIALFYVGSVILLTMVLPWNAYSSSESPFVTFFSKLGGHSTSVMAGNIMNVVVITAALSSINAGLYATGRTLRALGVAGEAPKFAAKLNRNKVPYGGITITAGLGLIGVLINYMWPTNAFIIIMNLSGIGIAGTWISVLISHMIFVRKSKQGLYQRPKYQLKGAPVWNILAIAFFLAVVVGIGFDSDGAKTMLMFAGVCVILVIGWFAVRNHIDGSLLEKNYFSGGDDGKSAAGAKPAAGPEEISKN